MRVLFLNPPFHARFSRESRSPAVAKSGTLYYPKWLCYAAGVAIQNKHEVDVIDAPAWEQDLKYVTDRIENKNIEALVCDTSTPSIVNDLKIINEIQEKFPKLPVILVGRHVSSMPDYTFKHAPNLKYIAIKEYEYTVRDWLEAVKSGANMSSVLGLMWRNEKDEVVKNPDRPSIENLDELPFVSEVYKKYLRVEDYFYGHSLWPLVVFDTSRGCPYRCTFCVYPQTFSGHRMRYRSVKNVADEFDFVARELPQVKTIMLEDDTFIIDKDRTLEIANELVARGNKLPFDSNCRADVKADVDFFKKLKKAGARLFCVGFESGNNDVLKYMKKNLNLNTAEQFMDNTKKAGIMVHGCFMVGNLNETKETMQETLQLAKHLMPDTAKFFPIMVYPGTAAYEEAKQRGLLATEDYSKWLTHDGLHNSVVNLPNLKHKDLVEFCDRARKEFYTNPKYLVRKAKQSLTSLSEFQRNLKGFKTLVKYLVKGSYHAGDVMPSHQPESQNNITL